MDTPAGDIRAVAFASSRGGGRPVLPERLDRIPADAESGSVTAELPAAGH